PILILTAAEGAPAQAPAARPSTPVEAPKAVEPRPTAAASVTPRPVPREPQEETGSKPHASPSVRKFARELGVDLAQAKGSGPKGRILHEDVQAFVKGVLSNKTISTPAAKTGGALPFNLPPWPEVDFAKFG